ncbi:MAG: ABC transporter substrate-binding protein, partial [Synechococcus sp.]|nr:ABC transporter substrate-binding protein [Synechococcus sp.]
MTPADRQRTTSWLAPFGAVLLGLAQLACQPITTETGRITVASAGKISSLDPAQASTVNTIQLLSAL